MKGELLDIQTLEDDFRNRRYRIVIEFDGVPPFKLGDVEVKQK